MAAVLVLFCSVPVRGNPEPAHAGPASPPAPAEAAESPAESDLDPAIKTEIAGYTQLAKDAADKEKWPMAEHFLELLVNLPASNEAKKSGMREIAENYEKHRQYSKAIAISEKMIELFPSEPDTPDLIFKVAMLYREAGVYNRAIARFYTVLNSALKVNERGVSAYRTLTQRAQMEIAETYFLSGDYAQSAKFWNLLLRLELPPDQRVRVQFRSLHCQYLLNEPAKAIVSAQKFLEEFPDDASAPEVRYLLAAAFKAAGRKKESFETVVALMRAEKVRKEKAPERWAFWQKKAGNEFANDYYKQGDFFSALTIYQALAQLADDPDWQWPVIYQMGLCFERLRLPKRAAEAYKYIIDESKKPETAKKTLTESTRNIVQMAQWRGEQIAWHDTTDTRLQRILGESLDAGLAIPPTEFKAAKAEQP